MTTTPVAIYRARTRSLLLAAGDQSIVVDEDRVPRLARALRQVVPMLAPRSTLRIFNASGRVFIHGCELPSLCDAIDEAFGIPAHAAALLAEPIGG